MRAAALLALMPVAGCGEIAPRSDVQPRTWEYYVAHPAEIEPMQKNLPLIVGIKRASGGAAGSGDDQLPRGGLRQLTAPTGQVNATRGI